MPIGGFNVCLLRFFFKFTNSSGSITNLTHNFEVGKNSPRMEKWSTFYFRSIPCNQFKLLKFNVEICFKLTY